MHIGSINFFIFTTKITNNLHSKITGELYHEKGHCKFGIHHSIVLFVKHIVFLGSKSC
jgi:hypothetical protein